MSGIVKLSTLDRESMSNWVSGCRIKKYELPLTNDMLEHMHATRNRKATTNLKKKYLMYFTI